jgi:lipopolysaccharide transport system permease protein
LSEEKIVIDPHFRSSLSIGEIIRYKGLLVNLAKRDFLVRYKQAAIGVSWAVIRPLINVLVFGYVSSKINAQENAVSSYINVGTAMILWQLFNSVFNDVSNSMIGNANLFSKVYFPKIVIPLSTIGVCLVDFFISFFILMVMFLIAGQELQILQLFLIPVIVLFTLINALGIGLMFATWNVKFRDVKFIVPLMLQVGMFVTPVVFSTSYYLERLPDWFMPIYFLNPMVSAIDGFKFLLIGSELGYDMFYFIQSALTGMVLLWIGLRYFYRFERNFVDYI